MTWYIKNEFDYNDNGRKIHKQEWVDDATGETWDAFNDIGTWDDPAATNSAPSMPQLSSGDGGSTWSQQGPYAQPSTTAAAQNQGSQMPSNQGPAQDYGAQAWSAQAGMSPGVPAQPSGSMYTGKSDLSADRGNFRFPLNDPGFAVQNALRGLGVSPMSWNPMTQSVLQRAPALMAAFMTNAANGYNPGADAGNAFGNFLRDIISRGSITDVLGNAASNFGNTVNTARNFSQQFAQNPQAGEQINPLLASLASMIGQGGGMGGLSLLQSLMSGLLPRTLAGPYSQALSTAGNAARDAMFQDSTYTSNSDLFQYLFQ